MAALEGLDAADIFITSGVTLIQSEPPANSFMLEDVAGVGVVQNSADGVKCERCWKILPEVSLNNEPVCNRCAYSLKFAPFKFAPAHDPHD
jgi:isoleucyl-tRNA synthetase